MAHLISKTNGKDAFFSVKEVAWHGLGTIVQDCPTSDKAIILAGLDYEVEKCRMYYEETRGEDDTFPMRPNKTVFTTVRKDTHGFLGTVGSRYEVLQNIECFKWFDEIVGQGQAIYQTAGALNGGATIFITAKLPSYIRVKSDDIEKYLVLTNSHDASETLQMMFTPIRVVCANTLNQAMKSSKNVFKMRHTKSMHDNMKIAAASLGIISKTADDMQEMFVKMVDTPFGDATFTKLLNLIYPAETFEEKEDGNLLIDLHTRTKNTWDDIRQYREVGLGQDNLLCRGTTYGAYNAITGYFQNMKKFKNQEDKLESVLYGDTAQKTQKAFTALVNWTTKGTLN